MHYTPAKATQKPFLRIAVAAFLLLNVLSSGFAQENTIPELKSGLKTVKTDTAKVTILNKIAHIFRESNSDSTLFYAKKAAALAQKNGDHYGLAIACINIGNANIISSNYAEALKNFEQAKALFTDLLTHPAATAVTQNQIRNGLARSYGSCGIVYSEQNDYSNALQHYFKALKMYQETGEKKSISKVYNNIGIIYKVLEENNKALTYLSKAYALQTEMGEESAPVTLMNIGTIYFKQKKDKQALQHYNTAMSLFEKTNNNRGKALLFNNLGEFYCSHQSYAKALDFYNKAMVLYTELDNKMGTASVQYNIGTLYLEQKDLSKALSYTSASLMTAREINMLAQVKSSEKQLSDIYALQQDYKNALSHYKEYVAAKDSIDNKENTKKLLRVELNAEFQKKEALQKIEMEKKEAVLVEQNKSHKLFTLFSVIGTLLLLGLIFVTYNRLQIKRRLTLQKEVAEYEQKALHLQMNPHFVFNCLGSISSFIVQNGTDSAIKYLSKFSKLMRLTLEYSKGSLIPIDKEIDSLQNYLELEQLRFNKKFDFAITTSPLIEDDMALPPLLIQPFVENAILHGLVPKQGSGKIEISFNVENNQLVCSITDDGIGISKSKAMKENSVTAHKSMALEITKKRLEMMEATTSQSAHVSISDFLDENKEPYGTRVVIYLPIQYTSDTKIRI
ncbi:MULTISPECIES: tetratricopeptide repeat protein [unclassified Flavobacterium]|uniref:tetratricopeptide repeat-containing sensor histidine kinase n=1 Tax=unclassified Flavobacterium TaxID=196869 RepID=UPI00086F8569|nr:MULTISPECIES: tetratricopeptide repeat protein [unclassified Flavobacterium]MBN9283121.1 tetratricopeptide repeat protein [Flavobacterium sp.]ODS86626.1 MAG: hypothetical protein ABS44_13020 [Chryseobacterium sp. SCN 40-13]OJV67750.1 MAG: hypothetical protein BGO42_17140 [Flavobacterium sp. 40-81]